VARSESGKTSGPVPPTAPAITNVVPAGCPVVSLSAGAALPSVQLVELAVTLAPRNERCTVYVVFGVLGAAVVNVRLTSSGSVPPSILPTVAARLAGASCAVPPVAVASAHTTHTVRPALPPVLWVTFHPIERPLESRTGAFPVRFEPGFVVEPPPPRATFPVGHRTPEPLAWIVIRDATPDEPVGPVAPVGPCRPVGPCEPVGPCGPIAP